MTAKFPAKAIDVLQLISTALGTPGSGGGGDDNVAVYNLRNDGEIAFVITIEKPEHQAQAIRDAVADRDRLAAENTQLKARPVDPDLNLFTKWTGRKWGEKCPDCGHIVCGLDYYDGLLCMECQGHCIAGDTP